MLEIAAREGVAVRKRYIDPWKIMVAVDRDNKTCRVRQFYDSSRPVFLRGIELCEHAACIQMVGK
jgi:hypothetical protein